MPLTAKLQQLVADLAMIDDPQERLSAIVDRTKKLPSLPLAARIEANRVRGCVSVVWLAGEFRDGRCYFTSAAESPIVGALVAFVAEFFSGFTPEQILAGDSDPLEALDVTRNLSPTRRNGLAAARAAIRTFAQANAPARRE